MPIHLAEIAPPEASPALARLMPLTDEANRAVRGQDIGIRSLPFRVGCESRGSARRVWRSIERRLGRTPQNNDLYLLQRPVDGAEEVSREHFLIEAVEGRFFLVDRGSARGTLVQGVRVGGDGQGGRLEIHDRDVIVVGTTSSPMVFRFVCADGDDGSRQQDASLLLWRERVPA